MALTTGSRLGPYEILSPLGAGGMGEVYKARDTRLDRMVAVKVLPDVVAADPERRERFEREARAVSSLNHPHICALYDVGHQGGVDYLVMELLDGESLAQRLIRGPLPLEQALRHAIEIADALSKAHRQGIVHRDLKPANVMLTKQGAKLLDFGLARVGVAAQASSASFLPTQEALTQQGTLLGTFQYMAPEQLEGREADARTDIFAFGALLYEMVTGRKAFEGKSQASLVVSIMSGTPPPISAVQPMTPPSLDRVVRVCLAKDPDERWQTAQDLAAELKWIAEGGSQVGAPAPVVARRKSRERWAWVAAAFFASLAAIAGGRLLTTREVPRKPMRFSIEAPKGIAISWPRLSPDGATVAFVGADSQGTRSIWIRALDSFEPVRLEGTEGVQRPFWSPDSHYLAFFAGGQLKKVPVSGGPPLLICEARYGADGAWSSAGVILFDGRPSDPVQRVSDSGGVPTVAAAPDAARKEVGTAWPFFLPDGHHFLFVGTDNRAPVSLKLGSLDSPQTTFLAEVQSRAEYSSGYVFYVARQTLVARPLSLDKLAFSGDPFPVTDRIQILNAGLVDFSTSAAGDLAYIPNAQAQQSRLAWLDRAGKEMGTVGEPGVYRDLALSPDETHVAVSAAANNGPPQISVIDLKRGVASSLTFGEDPHTLPLWSREGKWIFYHLDRSSGHGIARKLATGAGDDEMIHEEKEEVSPSDASPDGKILLVQWYTPENADIVTMAVDGSGALTGYLRAPKPIFEGMGRFSPDGRWVAYQSNESGRNEVFVQPFPASGGKWQISGGGGGVPMWRGDGKEIFYQGPDDMMYAVLVRAEGSNFEAGVPTKLFQRRLQHAGRERNRWVVTRDGQRFLLNVLVGDSAPQGIQVVLNWAAGLKK